MIEKINIKAQYALWVGVVTLGAVILLTAIHVWRAFEDLEVSVRWVAQQEAKMLAHVIAAPLAQADQKLLIRTIGQAVNSDDVLYLCVRDEKGDTLFQNRNSSGLIVASQPVQYLSKPVGTVEVGMWRRKAGQQLAITLAWDFGVGFFLVVIAMWASLEVSGPIQESLKSLLKYVQGVTRGGSSKKEIDTNLAEADAVAKELRVLMQRVEGAQERQERLQQHLKTTQKELDEYTYVIGHDLKEPLCGIEAFSKFLLDGYSDRLDEEGLRHLGVIRKSVVRMQQLIDDLLHFSRLSQQKPITQQIGMNTMLMHIRVRLQHAMEVKNVDLRVNRLPTIVCDETAIKEVFHNLISNAIKYNNNPRPVIEVGCTERVSPETQQAEYVFFVRDNGVGIKKEYFEKIFQIFQRLQRDEEGTGIGLTIVRRVVEWHGGRVWVESEEGKGTTFYFSIPKREVASTETTIKPVRLPQKEPARATVV